MPSMKKAAKERRGKEFRDAVVARKREIKAAGDISAREAFRQARTEVKGTGTPVPQRSERD